MFYIKILKTELCAHGLCLKIYQPGNILCDDNVLYIKILKLCYVLLGCIFKYINWEEFSVMIIFCSKILET